MYMPLQGFIDFFLFKTHPNSAITVWRFKIIGPKSKHFIKYIIYIYLKLRRMHLYILCALYIIYIYIINWSFRRLSTTVILKKINKCLHLSYTKRLNIIIFNTHTISS